MKRTVRLKGHRITRTEPGHACLCFLMIRQRLDEQIPGMRVNMHKMRFKNLPHIDVIESVRNMGTADACGFNGFQICNFDVADIFQGQSPGRAIFPINFGKTDMRIVGKITGKTLGIAPLNFKIQFPAGDRSKFFGEPVQVHPLADMLVILEPAKGQHNSGEVCFHNHINAWTQHFDDNFFGFRISDFRQICLGQRCRAQGFG